MAKLEPQPVSSFPPSYILWKQIWGATPDRCAQETEASSAPSSQPRAMVSPQDGQATGISYLLQPCFAEGLFLIGFAKRTEFCSST